MAKRFNITGTCIPGRHYMADMSGKLDQIRELVANADYFTIHRPRQYGKTTILFLLEQQLKKDKNYLDRPDQNQGYLIIFDLRKESGQVGEWQEIEAHGKEIAAAWV
jgi:hypothetical protein